MVDVGVNEDMEVLVKRKSPQKPATHPAGQSPCVVVIFGVNALTFSGTQLHRATWLVPYKSPGNATTPIAFSSTFEAIHTLISSRSFGLDTTHEDCALHDRNTEHESGDRNRTIGPQNVKHEVVDPGAEPLRVGFENPLEEPVCYISVGIKLPQKRGYGVMIDGNFLDLREGPQLVV
ncbi:hypothetical protein RJT34_11843 [Clitoria ternatea]|uniref:Uncharacterized protein n=1 Tax=Clitoria ternatea TaxID=43366 RepID=A0AAN9JMP0_CLITE